MSRACFLIIHHTLLALAIDSFIRYAQNSSDAIESAKSILSFIKLAVAECHFYRRSA